MHSDTPKVMHRVAGKALLEHVVQTASVLNPNEQPIVIYGHEGEKLKHFFAELNVHWVEQTEQLGTGHALLQALPSIPDSHQVLVLYGDVPLIGADTLKKLIQNNTGQ